MDITIKEEDCNRKRAANFSKPDEELLIAIIKKYKTKIECKKSDVNSSVMKNVAWTKVTNEFNASSNGLRSLKELKNKYDNIKKQVENVNLCVFFKCKRNVYIFNF